MKYLIAIILGIEIICVSCWYGSKAIFQVEKQQTVTETPQIIAVEEQIPTPEEQVSTPEEASVDTYNESTSTSNKYDMSSFFAKEKKEKEKKEKEIDVSSLDYQIGFRNGYNDGCRGYYRVTGSWYYSNYLAGYAKGYSKGYAEWSAKEREKYLRKKYSSPGRN